MRVEVISPFVDRYTREVRKPGEICEYSRDRVKELARGGFVKEVIKGKVAPVQPEKGKGDP